MSAFRVEVRERGIVHLVMDDPARRVNVLDEAAIESLEAALAQIEAMPGLAGVVVRSGKPGSFIAGADVQAIGSITDRPRALALVRRAHAALQRLATLPAPTVAAIDGVCLGGGTEIALACDSRIASEEAHTQIGLPEVLLGIIPGFGGTTRLPRLIGLTGALDLILTGRALDARRAEKLGLIARAVPAAWLVEQAEAHLAKLAKRLPARRRDRYRPRGLGARLIDGTPFGRAFALSRARAMTRGRTGGHYPAPFAAMRVIEHGLGQPVERGLELEANEVSELVISTVCKNLLRIFLLSEAAKKAPAVPGRDLAPAPVARMALVGAGIMGGGIAELASRGGIDVRMRDVSAASLTRALQTAWALIEERLRRRRGPAAARQRERDAQLARIQPTLELSGLARADFVIEAVIEDLDIKRRVFAELEVRARPDAVIATNTSSLSVTTLAEGLERPDRFCGFHFFNPVHRMPLVEVVRGKLTSDAALVTAVALARRLGKTPVVVQDAPGFVVNRILMPYLREAMHLLDEGYPLRDIDAAMRRFGMPMGPFEVIDEVGLDVGARVAGILSRAFPDRMQPAPALDRLIAAGRLGKKSGAGFYRHRGGRRAADPELARLLGISRSRTGHTLEGLCDRMVAAMVNEAARCLEDGVVADAGMLDLAMIYGTGFPPFRGGPLRHADAVGLAKLESQLAALRAEKGPRFEPSRRLVELARSGGSFTQPLA
jgi:3-hydroxyacyl-CoA dehydrogenase / enoyl-CoA hydratase / 3-hydroxybutyryl-CoA epimerase